MIVGVPCEVMESEYRVAITPVGAHELVPRYRMIPSRAQARRWSIPLTTCGRAPISS